MIRPDLYLIRIMRVVFIIFHLFRLTRKHSFGGRTFEKNVSTNLRNHIVSHGDQTAVKHHVINLLGRNNCLSIYGKKSNRKKIFHEYMRVFLVSSNLIIQVFFI